MKKKPDFKEIAKRNIFVAHAADIKHLSDVKGVDVGIAADMFAVGKATKIEDKKEFLQLCREWTLRIIAEDVE